MFCGKYGSTETLGNTTKHDTKWDLVKYFFYHLLRKPCAEQPYESQRRPTDRRLPTAEAVSEHADHWRTEEDHAHGQSPDPSCGKYRIYSQRQKNFFQRKGCKGIQGNQQKLVLLDCVDKPADTNVLQFQMNTEEYAAPWTSHHWK